MLWLTPCKFVKPRMRGTSVVVALRWYLLLHAVALAGCSNTEPTGTISGKITFQGKPVSAGLITLDSEEGGIHAVAELQSDGSYRLDQSAAGGLPCLTYQV